MQLLVGNRQYFFETRQSSIGHFRNVIFQPIPFNPPPYSFIKKSIVFYGSFSSTTSTTSSTSSPCAAAAAFFFADSF